MSEVEWSELATSVSALKSGEGIAVDYSLSDGSPVPVVVRRTYVGWGIRVGPLDASVASLDVRELVDGSILLHGRTSSLAGVMVTELRLEPSAVGGIRRVGGRGYGW